MCMYTCARVHMHWRWLQKKSSKSSLLFQENHEGHTAALVRTSCTPFSHTVWKQVNQNQKPSHKTWKIYCSELNNWIVSAILQGRREATFPFPEKSKYIDSNCLEKSPGPQELLVLISTFSTPLIGDRTQPRCDSAKKLLEDGGSITEYLFSPFPTSSWSLW